MKKIILTSILFFAFGAQAENYGKSFDKNAETYSVEEAMKKLASGEAEALNNVVVEGEISSVCQSKGCWVTLKTPGTDGADSCDEALKGASLQKELRVKFKNHSFAVPKNLKGKVRVYGSLTKKKLSKFQLKHLLKDANCEKAQLKKVKGAKYRYQMAATGLQSL